MGSVRHTTVAAGRSKIAPDQAEIWKAAKLLMEQHGDDADVVAARRADTLLRNGQLAEGKRWLDVFQQIARSYFRPA
jgi:hypothetical protein